MDIPAIQIGGNAGVPLQKLRHRAGVVIVPVGQQNAGGGAAGFLHGTGHPVRVGAGVHNGADTRLLIAKDIAVGHNRANLHGNDFHGKDSL